MINRADVYCPFYRQDKDTRIMCEPLIKPAQSQVTYFKNVPSKEQYMQRICFNSDCTKKCRIARALARWYSGEEGNEK